MQNGTQRQEGQVEPFDILLNILRIISMLEKAIERKARQSWLHPGQYPETYFIIESALRNLRRWIEIYRPFCHVRVFHQIAALSLETITQIITDFIITNRPVKGKKEQRKSRQIKEHESISNSIHAMLTHIHVYLEKLKLNETTVEFEIEKALINAFEFHCSQQHERCSKRLVSKRGQKTIIFPFSNKSDYPCLVEDKKAFRLQVVDKIQQLCNVDGHADGCNGQKGYYLRGFRKIPRKTIVEGGRQGIFPIRMVECINCHQRFSLLPSFLPREKHFSIDIIGNILRGILLFSHSLNSAFENTKLTGYALKSKQTLLNWIAWMGTHHPATVLTRAKAKSSGYFQEDEGFEKEPDLRTYTVAMVDCDTLLVWHLDYVDRVDEATLCASFEKFVERIDFNLIGVTKDKWKASTNALQSVFHRLWIGFCHRHCLKKFRLALTEYQKQTKCTHKEAKRLYAKFKEILDSSTSQTDLRVKIKLSNEAAFAHPTVHSVINEVEKNASHYTVHNKRQKIRKTTSLVDNFLKTVKRKLKQVESFRDRNWTTILFRAMANVRNFVPFLPGSKNAHYSPFMLASGQTFDLPWIQAMNMHNAFLFTHSEACSSFC